VKINPVEVLSLSMLTGFHLHASFLWLMAASFVAGWINAMAGGGSFISFPALLGIGIPPIQANATNTVALWPGQLTSLWALRSDLRRDLLGVVLAASVLGGVGGAVVLLITPQVTFMHLIPCLLLVASLLFWVSAPVSRWLRRRTPHAPRQTSVLSLFVMMLPVCFYVGYFGAGAGFLLMSVLALYGLEDIRVLNSLKVLAACASNLCAVVTFICGGAIVWRYCLTAMIFAAVGGYAGAHYARKMSASVLRAIVVVTGCVMAAYFFYRYH
jgi:uncharacterized membrane protein YfcA